MDIIDDVKGLMKRVMFSCSCIQIMPPRLDQLHNNNNNIVYTNEYNLLFKKMSYEASKEAFPMVILYESNIISYIIGNAIWKLNLVENNLDMNRIYWNNLINIGRCKALREIKPFYYFV